MVYSGENTGSCEWVAFQQEQRPDANAFDSVVPNKSRPAVRGESARRRKHDSFNSPPGWMKQPITNDSSWAPVAPPVSNITTSESMSSKRRPPRTNRDARGILATQESKNSAPARTHNPVSSSDSSASSADRPRSPSRGRSVERTTQKSMERKASNVRGASVSRRGRSRTRSATESSIPTTLASQRGRGTSRGRSTSRSRSAAPRDRERSSSATRRSRATGPSSSNSERRGRSNSRPPPTSSNRRARSNSRTPVTTTRARSTSRTRSSHRPPPSTTRTRREMRTTSSSSVGPGSAPRRASHRSANGEDDLTSLRSMDANIGRDISFGRTRATRSVTSNSSKRSGLMEKLFGDQVSEEARQAYLPRAEPSPTASVSSTSWQQPEQIHSRILLTATVYHNTATNLWIATINTNQKGVAKNPATASKYLKAFSFATEKEARESAIANAPPKMISFDESPLCFICKGKFAMFRRAGHCRNCGVCVCNSCSTMWPAKMLPETYNLKKESQVKICKSCNYLSSTFKKALVDGDYEEAVALYGSGNINLRTPFPQSSKKKDEILYPIHCAVEGGNLNIVRWLIEDHFCPIKVIRMGSGKKQKRGGNADMPILSSKNRSVLSIAMAGLHVEILRYLVIDCGVSIYESKDIKAALRALEAVLLALPEHKSEHRGELMVARWDDTSFVGDDEVSATSSLGADQTLPDEDGATVGSKDPNGRRNVDACIICYDNAIDCVMTPCGHQVCCLECSANLSACPVCNMRGVFIKIFRP